MDDVLKKADDLARAIRESGRYQDLRRVEADLAEDEATRALMTEFDEAQRAVAEKEQAGKPIEVADKRRVASAQTAVQSSQKLQTLLRAQADFYEMMQKVNGTIQGILHGDGGEAG